MNSGPSAAWVAALILIVALAWGFYFAYRRDGRGEEFGDFTPLPT